MSLENIKKSKWCKTSFDEYTLILSNDTCHLQVRVFHEYPLNNTGAIIRAMLIVMSIGRTFHLKR